MKYLRIRNFEKFQHYKDRNPPWIKLYGELWSDIEFFRLDDASKAHLLGLFILASKTDNKIPLDPVWIKHEIRATHDINIDALIASKFVETEGRLSPACQSFDKIDDPSSVVAGSFETDARYNPLKPLASVASKLLATRKQNACLETEERQSRGETEGEEAAGAATRAQLPESKIIFGEFGNVRLTADEHAKLELRLSGHTAEYIERLSRWGAEQPAKFNKRKNHYATILTWFNRDQQDGRIRGIHASRENPNVTAAKDFVSRKLAETLRSDLPDVREEFGGLPGTIR